MNKSAVTLQTAILIQVKEFAKQNQTFSLHEITRAIRNKVNKGELEIPEVEVTGATFHFDIPHTRVKSLFEESWKNGMFDPDFKLNKKFNGQYNEYTPVLANNPVPSFASPGAATPPVTLTHATLDSKTIQDRIEMYLNSCINKGVNPTLKQVQSAIKRGSEKLGVTCQEIRDIIQNNMGHQIVDSVSCKSESTVQLP